MLKVLQQLSLLHDFILGFVQLNPAGTNARHLAPSTGEREHYSKNTGFLHGRAHRSHLHVCIEFLLQV